MEYTEYMELLELIWKYFPYCFFSFVLLTFLPKSLRNIKRFADADYAANRYKYHRCYGPDLCCHMLIDDDDDRNGSIPKQKPRKAVTRAYLRRNQQQQQQQQLSQRSNSADFGAVPPALAIKRQVQASAIQTQTNVNQIAKMFEKGSGSMAHRKINRVLPEIRTKMFRSIDAETNDDAARTTTKTSIDDQPYKKMATHSLQEDIENSVNLLHQQTTTTTTTKAATEAETETETAGNPRNEEWLPTAVLQRRTRTVPNTLSYAGTSATPSTASPAASSPQSSPASNSPAQPSSPILRAAPLNLKTSVEDIFAAIARSAEKSEEKFIYTGCNSLSPVTSIDDILSQRRLSRPLSAYSISDLLNEEATTTKDDGVNGDGDGDRMCNQDVEDENSLFTESYA